MSGKRRWENLDWRIQSPVPVSPRKEMKTRTGTSDALLQIHQSDFRSGRMALINYVHDLRVQQAIIRFE